MARKYRVPRLPLMLAVVIVAGTAVEVKLFVEVFVIAMRKKARKPEVAAALSRVLRGYSPVYARTLMSELKARPPD